VSQPPTKAPAACAETTRGLAPTAKIAPLLLIRSTARSALTSVSSTHYAPVVRWPETQVNAQIAKITLSSITPA
jgi:hypothetical protein